MAKVNGPILTRRTGMLNNTAKENIAAGFNALLSKTGYQKRFEELLGDRAPQFIGSLVTMISDDKNMLQVYHDSPISIIKAALRAATYDLPIDPALGQAYVIPFKNNKKGIMEAVFILGYKGLYQLAVRTGAYRNINVVDVREGELVSWDRLTEQAEFNWMIDEDERQKTPVIGYIGRFELTNGFTKTVYMTKAQIDAHEKKFRKGAYMGKGWRDDWDAMASKTVLRKLLSKWGLLSISYQIQPNPAVVKFATDLASGQVDDTNMIIEAEAHRVEDVPAGVDPETGEVEVKKAAAAAAKVAQDAADDQILEDSLNV